MTLNEIPAHFNIMCDDFNAKIGLKSAEEETALESFGTPERTKRKP